MTLGSWLQFGLIGVAVAASAVHTLGKMIPGFDAGWRRPLARWLDKNGRPAFLRRAGSRIGGRLTADGDGCGGGCGDCGCCGGGSPKALRHH